MPQDVTFDLPLKQRSRSHFLINSVETAMQVLVL